MRPRERRDLGAILLGLLLGTIAAPCGGRCACAPVAPSGQENERYWRLAGRTSRAGCGRSYARHKLAIAADLPGATQGEQPCDGEQAARQRAADPLRSGLVHQARRGRGESKADDATD